MKSLNNIFQIYSTSRLEHINYFLYLVLNRIYIIYKSYDCRCIRLVGKCCFKSSSSCFKVSNFTIKLCNICFEGSIFSVNSNTSIVLVDSVSKIKCSVKCCILIPTDECETTNCRSSGSGHNVTCGPFDGVPCNARSNICLVNRYVECYVYCGIDFNVLVIISISGYIIFHRSCIEIAGSINYAIGQNATTGKRVIAVYGSNAPSS